MKIRQIATTMTEYPSAGISLLIHTHGCQWRCAYCFNPGAVLATDAPLKRNRDALKILRDAPGWYQGVVISGGEPTMQRDLPIFCRECKALGLRVKLHTNGAYCPSVVETLLRKRWIDCLAVDYKMPPMFYSLDARRELLGIPHDDSGYAAGLYTARNSGIEHEYHTTLCPRFIDAQVMRVMAMFLKDPAANWYLQKYRADVPLLDAARAGAETYDDAQLWGLARIAAEYHPPDKVKTNW